MPCIAVKSDGRVCDRQTANRAAGDAHPAHLDLCTVHSAQYERQYTRAGNVHHVEGMCITFMTTHRWCTRQAANGRTCCATHHAANERKLAREEDARNRRLQTTMLFQDQAAVQPLLNWQTGVRAIFNRAEFHHAVRHSAAVMYYRYWRVAEMDEPQWQNNRMMWRFTAYWRWLWEGANEAAPPDLVNPPMAWLAAGGAALAHQGVGGLHAQMDALRLEIANAMVNGEGAPPAPRAADARGRDLARLAADSQNVHTSAVTTQTNEMQRKLLEIIVPPTQHTEQTITREWLALPGQPRWTDILRTLNDINKWFNTRSCRTNNDNLYRGILRGAVAKIEATPNAETRKELFKRLREECFESVGLCCEGHLSRLCNVFVGFDSEFQSPISMNEMMQNEMAAIAASDLPTEEKLALARAWFESHAVPEIERNGWLAAIESM